MQNITETERITSLANWNANQLSRARLQKEIETFFAEGKNPAEAADKLKISSAYVRAIYKRLA